MTHLRSIADKLVHFLLQCTIESSVFDKSTARELAKAALELGNESSAANIQSLIRRLNKDRGIFCDTDTRTTIHGFIEQLEQVASSRR